MKKLNEVLANKLILQAAEAKTVGLTKISEAVYDAVASVQIVPQQETFNYDELESVAHAALWKVACTVAAYHDLQSADIQKIHQIVVAAADKFVREVETQLEVGDKIGQFEDNVPGQVKR